MHRYLLYILLCFPALIHAQTKDWLEGYDSLLRVSTVGIECMDLTTDSIIFAYNEHLTLRPASTMKLTTAVAALDILGGDYSLCTSMRCTGNIRASRTDRSRNVMEGDITLIGGMDPCFSSDDMHAFIDTLRTLKIDTIYGGILEDKSLKDTLLLGSGWCWDDKNPQLTPLLYNEQNNLLKSFKDSLAVHNIIVVAPTFSIPFSTSLFQLSTSNFPLSTFRFPPSFTITRHHSIDQVLCTMHKKSHNLYAEALFYQLSPTNRRSPLFTGKTSNRTTARDIARTINSFVTQKIYNDSSSLHRGREESDVSFSDGSGLSLYNYQSADYQVRLLRYAYQHQEIYSHLYPALPIAGVDGTLSNRMADTPAQGNVHAKTGTLTGVSSLAGYLTASNGHTICFSIINQGCLRSKAARDFQDKLCVMMCTHLPSQ